MASAASAACAGGVANSALPTSLVDASTVVVLQSCSCACHAGSNASVQCESCPCSRVAREQKQREELQEMPCQFSYVLGGQVSASPYDMDVRAVSDALVFREGKGRFCAECKMFPAIASTDGVFNINFTNLGGSTRCLYCEYGSSLARNPSVVVCQTCLLLAASGDADYVDPSVASVAACAIRQLYSALVALLQRHELQPAVATFFNSFKSAHAQLAQTCSQSSSSEAERNALFMTALAHVSGQCGQAVNQTEQAVRNVIVAARAKWAYVDAEPMDFAERVEHTLRCYTRNTIAAAVKLLSAVRIRVLTGSGDSDLPYSAALRAADLSAAAVKELKAVATQCPRLAGVCESAQRIASAWAHPAAGASNSPSAAAVASPLRPTQQQLVSAIALPLQASPLRAPPLPAPLFSVPAAAAAVHASVHRDGPVPAITLPAPVPMVSVDSLTAVRPAVPAAICASATAKAHAPAANTASGAASEAATGPEPGAAATLLTVRRKLQAPKDGLLLLAGAAAESGPPRPALLKPAAAAAAASNMDDELSESVGAADSYSDEEQFVEPDDDDELAAMVVEEDTDTDPDPVQCGPDGPKLRAVSPTTAARRAVREGARRASAAAAQRLAAGRGRLRGASCARARGRGRGSGRGRGRGRGASVSGRGRAGLRSSKRRDSTPSVTPPTVAAAPAAAAAGSALSAPDSAVHILSPSAATGALPASQELFATAQPPSVPVRAAKARKLRRNDDAATAAAAAPRAAAALPATLLSNAAAADAVSAAGSAVHAPVDSRYARGRGRGSGRGRGRGRGASVSGGGRAGLRSSTRTDSTPSVTPPTVAAALAAAAAGSALSAPDSAVHVLSPSAATGALPASQELPATAQPPSAPVRKLQRTHDAATAAAAAPRPAAPLPATLSSDAAAADTVSASGSAAHVPVVASSDTAPAADARRAKRTGRRRLLLVVPSGAPAPDAAVVAAAAPADGTASATTLPSGVAVATNDASLVVRVRRSRPAAAAIDAASVPNLTRVRRVRSAAPITPVATAVAPAPAECAASTAPTLTSIPAPSDAGASDDELLQQMPFRWRAEALVKAAESAFDRFANKHGTAETIKSAHYHSVLYLKYRNPALYEDAHRQGLAAGIARVRLLKAQRLPHVWQTAYNALCRPIDEAAKAESGRRAESVGDLGFVLGLHCDHLGRGRKRKSSGDGAHAAAAENSVENMTLSLENMPANSPAAAGMLTAAAAAVAENSTLPLENKTLSLQNMPANSPAAAGTLTGAAAAASPAPAPSALENPLAAMSGSIAGPLSASMTDDSPHGVAAHAPGPRPRTRPQTAGVRSMPTADSLAGGSRLGAAASAAPKTDGASGSLVFKAIRQNVGWERVRSRRVRAEDAGSCDCRVPLQTHLQAHRAALVRCGAQCLNRALSIECTDESCSFGARGCSNRELRDGPGKPVIITDASRIADRGLLAGEAIGTGEFITQYVGEWRRLREYESQGPNFYGVEIRIDGQKWVLDATRCGSPYARLVNHSCDPNCRLEKRHVGHANGECILGLFAIRPIKAQEELTFNYGCFSKAALKDAFECRCGSAVCSSSVL